MTCIFVSRCIFLVVFCNLFGQHDTSCDKVNLRRKLPYLFFFYLRRTYGETGKPSMTTDHGHPWWSPWKVFTWLVNAGDNSTTLGYFLLVSPCNPSSPRCLVLLTFWCDPSCKRGVFLVFILDFITPSSATGLGDGGENLTMNTLL